MRRFRILSPLAVLAAASLSWAAPAAAAVTLGITSAPSGASPQQCTQNVLYAQTSDDPAASPFSVPAGGGMITSWQTDTTNAAENPGAPLTFVVLRPQSPARSFTVLGSDPVTIPNPLPAGGVASFTLATPIPVLPGDVLGLYSQAVAGPAGCVYHDGTTSRDDLLLETPPMSAPTPGESSVNSDDSPRAYVLDVAATLDNDVDAGVSATTGAGARAGQPAALMASVTNAGPATGPITFTATVPAGLTIDSAVAGGGSCSVSGQAVTCSITGLGPGQSAPVVALVTPTAAGSYAYTATVGVTGVADPNPANNVAGAALAVAPAPGPITTSTPGPTTPGRVGVASSDCHVPPLTGTPPAIAKRVLRLLDCGVGRTTTASSRKVRKGLVIASRPGSGKTLTAGTAIKLTVSSGPPKKKKKKPRR